MAARASVEMRRVAEPLVDRTKRRVGARPTATGGGSSIRSRHRKSVPPWHALCAMAAGQGAEGMHHGSAAAGGTARYLGWNTLDAVRRGRSIPVSLMPAFMRGRSRERRAASAVETITRRCFGDPHFAFNIRKQTAALRKQLFESSTLTVGRN